jgi:hypothetical protein
MATISKLIPGQILYDVHSHKMGNTTMRRRGLWTVKVIQTDTVNNRALCSWNCNAPRWMSERAIKRYRVNKPEPKGSIMGMPTY